MDLLLLSQRIIQFKLYDPDMDKNQYTRLPQNYAPCVVSASRRLQENVFDAVDVILLLTPHTTIKKRNDTAQLLRLLKNTKQPCFLFDPYQIWNQAAGMNHIQYVNLDGGA